MAWLILVTSSIMADSSAAESISLALGFGSVLACAVSEVELNV